MPFHRTALGLAALAMWAGCRAPLVLPTVQPELVAPGVLSTEANELNAAFTADGRTIYFTLASPDFSHNEIRVSHLGLGGWSKPVTAPFSGTWDDGDPFLAPDGRLFFMSKRPVKAGGAPKSDWDLWVMAPDGSGWGAPTHLGPEVNSDTDEYYPVVTRDGTLYFASQRADGLGESDLYRSRFVDGRYQKPENLGPSVNSPLHEHDAYVDPDERYMLFIVRNPSGGLGGAELFLSRRQGNGWSPRERLPAPLNSEGWDFCPVVSPDGNWLYFTSSRKGAFAGGAGNGLGDLYRYPMSALRPLLERR